MSESSTLGAGIGVDGFVARHGLHDDAQQAATDAVLEQIEAAGLRTVRLVLVDQHGLTRSKWLSPDAFRGALRNGADFSGAIYSMDSGNSVFTAAFAEGGNFGIEEFTGFPDIVVVPDPTTFRVLPWADRTGWVLCDAYFSNGRPVPLDPRRLLREQVRAAADLGYELVTGLEVEFYLLALDPAAGVRTGMPAPAPAVAAAEPGYQFLGDDRLDALEPVLVALRDALIAVGLPPRSIENEWGPGQVEISFAPMTGLAAADAMVLFRAAVKQVARRHGLLASFMCWPGLPNAFPSGWHLHSSLGTGAGNAFSSPDEALSDVGRQYAAGILDNAVGLTLLASPTVNGLRRFRPYSFAPDRVTWGMENRGVLLRVQGGPGDSGSHLEFRMGEPAANPYLFLAGAAAAGLDGLRRGATPPEMVGDQDPYTVEATRLPTSMQTATDALAACALLRGAFGDAAVDHLVMMKRAELARFTAAVGEAGDAVTGWEMDEYLESF